VSDPFLTKESIMTTLKDNAWMAIILILFFAWLDCTKAETFVGGSIIKSDEVWSKEKSPYILQGNVQLSQDAVLIIEPGVAVQGNGKSIRVWGTLSAVGTKDDPIIFEQTSIYPGNSQATSNKHGLITIQYSQLYRSKLYYPSGDAMYGSLILTDSYIEDLDWMYMWYPVRDSIIQRNVFIRPGLIDSGLTRVGLNISNNVFYKQSKPIVNWATYDDAKVVVERNSFLSAKGEILALKYDHSSMTAPSNYWGGLPDSEIPGKIIDKNDDLGLPGFIEYLPTLSEPDAETPRFTTHIVTVEGLEGGVVVFDHSPLETICNGMVCKYVYFDGVIATMTFVQQFPGHLYP